MKHTKLATILGMPFATARAQLQKALLFKYVKAAGHNVCFRCAKPIEDIGDFSVDHKLAWRKADNPQQLFGDTNNVAFSHLLCNTGARERRGGRPKKSTPISST